MTVSTNAFALAVGHPPAHMLICADTRLLAGVKMASTNLY